MLWILLACATGGTPVPMAWEAVRLECADGITRWEQPADYVVVLEVLTQGDTVAYGAAQYPHDARTGVPELSEGAEWDIDCLGADSVVMVYAVVSP